MAGRPPAPVFPAEPGPGEERRGRAPEGPKDEDKGNPMACAGAVPEQEMGRSGWPLSWVWATLHPAFSNNYTFSLERECVHRKSL